MPDFKFKPLSDAARTALAAALPDLRPDTALGSMRVTALAEDTVELLIYGLIGGGLWADESISARSVVEALQGSTAKTINVRISSDGGSVTDGFAIHNELRRQARNGVTVNVFIDSVAYSIASLIAAAGDSVTMYSNSLQMLHAPMVGMVFKGNLKDLGEVYTEISAWLETYGKAMAQSYARKTGKPASEFEAMWAQGIDFKYSAEEAKAFGLCDVILDSPFEEEDEALEEANALLMQQLVAQSPPGLAACIRAAFSPAVAQAALTAPAAKAPSRVPAAAGVSPPELSGNSKENHMPNANTPTPAADIQAAANKAAVEAVAALRARNVEIRALSEPHCGNPDIKAYVDEVIAAADPDITAADVGKRLLALLAKEAGPLNGGAGVVAGADQRDKTRRAMANAIEARAGVGKFEAQNPYRGHSMAELARECVAQVGVSTRGMDRREIVGLAFTHSTSDFPGLLGDTARKAVLKGYEEAEEQVDQFTRAVSVPDFKPTSLVGLGAFSDLLVVPENGEFKYGTFSEQSQSMQIATYGRLFSISRQAIINDDLGIFNEVPRKLGQAARRTIAKAVFDLINSNPILADGFALFSAEHRNLLTGSAISTASVDALRVAMANARDNDGNRIRVPLKALLTPLSLGGLARTVRTSQYEVGGNRNLTTPNIVQNTFEVIDDGRLGDASATAWYGVANPAFVDGIVIGYLDGNQTPYLEQEEGFTVDGVAWKVRLDAAPAVADYRGIYKNPGA
jgi:ATP-dependent protease ClpP protease subunit